MRQRRYSIVPALVGLAIAWASGSASAENIDPLDDGSQYAWAENAGWINAEPSGDGGSGLDVGDFELTGWMWGENIGWISMSCKNRNSCDTVDFGVKNDGAGNLSGWAWAENAGWINFAPSTAGVIIDVATGDFSGRAWGENIGWMTFASAGPDPYKVTTAWNCDPLPATPSGSPGLNLEKSGADMLLAWSSVAGATGFDIVRGEIGSLRNSGGDFSASAVECLGDNRTTPSLLYSSVPAPGDGFWFVVRGVNCAERSGLHGTYDSGGPSQVGARDSEIAASGIDCP